MTNAAKKDKIALVTGGNSGIGFSTAKTLCNNHCQVFITGRDRKKTERAAKELNCNYIIADLSIPDSIDKICQPFLKIGLDYLVNNAGIGYMIPVHDISTPSIEQHFSVNVFAPLLLIKNLVTALEARRGSVTNISSIITTRNATGFSIYSASKGALEAMTKSLAVELAPKNIRINAICPGAIETPMLENSNIPPDCIPQIRSKVLSMIPLQRRGVAEEVAAAVYAQLNSTYVTGSIWNVDGGVGA